MEVHGNVTINNLIEKQEITVESGGVLNFGPPQIEDENPDTELSGENNPQEVAALEKEDEELLLPIFKGSRENLRQFFAEVKGATPEQIYNKINAWIGDGRIANKFNMRNFHEILKKMKIFTRSYQALNEHIIR